MFTIIGGDGREYGPASVEQLRGWIAAGRANLQTQAKRVGTAEWWPLADFPEFAPADRLPPVLAGDDAPAAPAWSGAPTASATLAGPPLASRGVRLGAALVDGFLEWLCWAPCRVAVGEFLRRELASGDLTLDRAMSLLERASHVFSAAIPRALPFLILLAVVQGILLTLRGQSIGKLLWRIRIVRQQDGERPGFLRAFLLRGGVPYALEKLPLVGWLFWLVDVCFIFGEPRRCVHDYIAGTKVVTAGK